MKLPIIKRISKEDLKSADLPAWIDPLLTALNAFITPVTTALQGKLTFQDNFLANVISKTFTSATKLTINPRLSVDQSRLSITGVVPLYASGKIIDEFGWERNSDGSIAVTVNFNGGGSAAVTLLVLLG